MDCVRDSPQRVWLGGAQGGEGHYCISAIKGVDEDDESLREGYRALEHRLGHTEFFMVNELKRIPRPQAPVEIVRVLDDDLAERVNKAARGR